MPMAPLFPISPPQNFRALVPASQAGIAATTPVSRVSAPGQLLPQWPPAQPGTRAWV